MIFYAFHLLLMSVNIGTLFATESGSLATLCPVSCSCLGNVVDCSKRSLDTIPASLPHWVETLDLCNNAITSVQDGSLDGLDSITEINLSGNQLQSFNLSVLSASPRLTTVKLGHNRLQNVVSGSLSESVQISQLHLSRNEIASLQNLSLSALSSLRVLDISYNRIIILDNSSFPALPDLQHLFVGFNQIAALEPGTFSGLVNLEWLKLNKNRIRFLNKTVFSPLHQLKYLELDRNRIRVVPGLVFQGLDSLVSLRLRHNVISDLMDGAFWGLTKIQMLDLTFNNITTVSKRWLYGLDTLQQLSLARNQINQIESDAWKFCRHLAELDLRSNQLTAVNGKMFDGLDSLKILLMTGNQLLYLDNEGFHGLAALQLLDLSQNRISWTVEDGSSAFDSLTSLTRLHLTHNHIRSLSKRIFSGLSHLRQLHIEGNEISSIQVGAFESMRDLRDLRLNSTSLLCDCQLSWFARWLRDNGFQSSVSASCGFPQSLAGTGLLDVKPQQLICVNYAKPVVTRDPASLKALRYGNVTLTCDAASSSDSPLSISWKKDNEVLPDDMVESVVLPPGDGDGERIVSRVSSRLHLWPIQDSHAGRYQCIATNALGSSYSTKAVLTVNVFPTFIKIPQDVTVRSGATARLDCAASGIPVPEIALQKDGGDDFPAARERRMHIFPSDEMFFIVDVKAEDQGVYTCTAKNDVGVITANATLQVLEAPSFARRMENKSIRAGDTTVLECMSSGSPRPRITWLKDGTNLTRTLRHFFTANDQLLVIVHTEASDAGNYTCLLTNTLGSDKQTSRLSVMAADIVSDNGVAMTSDSTTITTGIIVIAVVVCVVGTSLIWVIVIYKTRQKAVFQLAGATFDASCHHGDGTMSEADGSAQRLLTGYGSSHGNNSLANLKFHDTGVDISDDLLDTVRYFPCHTSTFHDEIGDGLSRNYHRHSCCIVREKYSPDGLPVNTLSHWVDHETIRDGNPGHLKTFRVVQQQQQQQRHNHNTTTADSDTIQSSDSTASTDVSTDDSTTCQKRCSAVDIEAPDGESACVTVQRQHSSLNLADDSSLERRNSLTDASAAVR